MTKVLTDEEKKSIKWEARPVIYLTLSIDPKHIPTREAMLERLDIALDRLRDDVINAWDNVTEHAT